MKRKKNSKILIIIVGIILIITISGLLFIYYKNTNKNKLTETVVDQNNNNDINNNEKKETIDNSYTNPLPEYRNQYNNPYIMAKLEIPSLNINSLVTRYTDNSFYLENNIYNQRDGIGVPFFDYRDTDLRNAKQINIYGHNTTNPDIMNQLPFINLEKYLDESTFKNAKDVFLSIDEKKIEYKVIAVKVIEGSDNEHMKLIFHNNEDFLVHVSKLLQRTTYKDSMLEITSNDQLLVMQVCHYNPVNTYLLIICQKISN